MTNKIKPTLIFISFSLLFWSCKKDETTAGGVSQPTFYTFQGQAGFLDNSAIMSNDNHLLIAGMLNGQYSILKTTRSGQLVWRKNFGAGNTNRAITEMPSNELFAFGSTTRNYSTSRSDYLLVKMNSNGDTLWTKTYGGSNDDYGYQLIKTSDGNLLACGISYSFSQQGYCDIYMVKINTNGDTLWTKNFYSPQQEESFHIMETQNGEYLVTGTTDIGAREIHFLKVSAGGSLLWTQTIGPTDWKWGYSTVELPNGDLITCGEHTTGGYEQILIVKTDNAGNEYWEKELGTPTLSEEAYSIKRGHDGNFTLTGSSYDVNTGRHDIVVLKVDQNGNQLWSHTYGGSADDYGYDLIKDLNDDNLIIGTTYSNGQNPSAGNIFISRISDSGLFY